MLITGIEVIRGNPVVGALPGETLPVAVGDTVRVHMTVDHIGPAEDGAVWVAIGWQVGVVIPEFIEVFNSRTLVHFNDDEDYSPYLIDCDLPISNISGYLLEFSLYGNRLDMYAKIMEVIGPDIFTDIHVGAIEVTTAPVYEEVQETIFPYAYVYDGATEVSTFTFKSDPFTAASWVAENFAEAAATEVENKGGRLLGLRVFVDKSPLLWTDWKIEAESTPLGGVAKRVGRAVGIPLWAAILISALAIIGVIVTATWAIKTIAATFTHRPLSEEIKKAWSRETLISAIRDFETKLEHTPRPPEELDGMSDQELRDYCDLMAEDIAPTEVSWVPLAVIGGLGVLGIGSILALAATQRGK